MTLDPPNLPGVARAWTIARAVRFGVMFPFALLAMGCARDALDCTRIGIDRVCCEARKTEAEAWRSYAGSARAAYRQLSGAEGHEAMIVLPANRSYERAREAAPPFESHVRAARPDSGKEHPRGNEFGRKELTLTEASHLLRSYEAARRSSQHRGATCGEPAYATH